MPTAPSAIAAAAVLLLATGHAAHAQGPLSGAKVYEQTCQACHQPGGVGAPGIAPPIVSRVVANAIARQKDYLVHVALWGMTGTITLADGGTLTGIMPPQGGLSDEKMVAVLNYVLSLNKAKAAISVKDVVAARKKRKSAQELKQQRETLLK